MTQRCIVNVRVEAEVVAWDDMDSDREDVYEELEILSNTHLFTMDIEKLEDCVEAAQEIQNCVGSSEQLITPLREAQFIWRQVQQAYKISKDMCG
jgi:hypothetical protein